VLILHELEGKTSGEIAEALELGEEAVRSRLRRARHELAQRLADQEVHP
jgi:DNA-directed RNA polymerase specialized sigma24 family protein